MSIVSVLVMGLRQGTIDVDNGQFCYITNSGARLVVEQLKTKENRQAINFVGLHEKGLKRLR